MVPSGSPEEGREFYKLAEDDEARKENDLGGW